MKTFFAAVVLSLGGLAAAAYGAQPAPPHFGPGACPTPPHPIAALKAARCGYLVVPENRSKSSERTIRLAVAILPSHQQPPQPDPIVFMTGGPGESAINTIPFLVEAGINHDRDVIIMNQRGTLYDDPDMNCPELDQYNAEQVSLAFDAPSTGKVQAKAAAACRNRLAGRGIDLSAYNTTENERDFVDLRHALRIPLWNVYGYSYGTDLALSLMRDHPDGIRSVVVNSIVPPDIVNLPFTWGSFKAGMTAIFDDCAAQPSCESRYPHLLATLTELVNRLEKQPIVQNIVPPQGGAPVKVVLDGGALVNMLVANRPKPADMPRALTELAHGNPQIMLGARAASAEVPAHPEQALGMTQSLVCREWEPYGSTADVLRAGKEEFPNWPDSVLVNAPQLPFEHELCQAWNVPKGPDSQRVRVRSAIPTLVVSGDIDAKTGHQWGRYVANGLPNSTYVRIRNIGHWVIVQSPCAARIFRSFVNHPRSPDTTCVATVPRVSFKH